MTQLDRIVDEVRRAHAPDARSSIFEVRAEERGGTVTLSGESTSAEAVTVLARRLEDVDGVIRVVDHVVRCPADDEADLESALVRAAVAPVVSEPRPGGTQVNQYVVGHRLDLLTRREEWWRVRGEDGYIGWIHRGYLEAAEPDEARAWERGDRGESFVSLGAELEDGEGRVFARLPWGARIVADAPGRFRLPDGRHGQLSAGEVVAVDRLRDRFPLRGESVVRTARRWMGAPYLWGGVTHGGVDCSGLVQAVLWMHGIALPRDSDQQALIGEAVEPGSTFEPLRPGDLLFFAERSDRVTHVAVSLGGSHIIHAALGNGGVDVNDLLGERELDRLLKGLLVGCRRILPDES